MEPAYSMTDSTARVEKSARNKPNLIASIALQTMGAQPQHAQLLQSPKSTGGQENSHKNNFTYLILILYQHRVRNEHTEYLPHLEASPQDSS